MSDEFNPPRPPPVRENLRKARGHFSNEEMRTFNNFGKVVPSKNSKKYEPELEDHALLWSAGTVAPKFNYRVNAMEKRNSAWNQYLKERANAEAKAKINLTRKNKTGNNKNGNKNKMGNKGKNINGNKGNKTTKKLAFS
jgi:hypothetical protein